MGICGLLVLSLRGLEEAETISGSQLLIDTITSPVIYLKKQRRREVNTIEVKKEGNDLYIKIPSSLVYKDPKVANFLEYIRIKEIVSHSFAKDEDINTLSEEIKEKAWKKLKNSLMKEIEK